MWSDESKYNLKGPNGNLKVRRPKGKRLDPKYSRGMVRYDGGKGAIVWGCFSDFSGVRPIHLINGIMDRFLYRDMLKEMMVLHPGNNMPLLWTFQKDNDPKHMSKLVKQWFETNQIEVMKWPAQSPDLSPTENLWHQFELSLKHKGHFKSADELNIAAEAAWNEITQEKVYKLIKSMPKRCPWF